MFADERPSKRHKHVPVTVTQQRVSKRGHTANLTERSPNKRIRIIGPQQRLIKRSYHDAQAGSAKKARHEAELYPVLRSRTFTSFEGKSDRMLALALYLAARHPNDCMPFGLSSAEDVGITLYLDLCKWGPNLFDTLTRIFACAAQGRRFAILPLMLRRPIIESGGEYGGHVNMLIVDTKLKTIERFEPHGSSLDYIVDDIKKNILNAKTLRLRQHWQDQLKHVERARPMYNSECQVNDQIQQLADYALQGYTYIPPLELCPLQGFQYTQELEVIQNRAGDLAGKKVGFCVAWSYWYADLRLRYPDIPPKQLIERAMRELKNNQGKKTLTEYIVSFASFFESLSPFLNDPMHVRHVIEALT